MGSFSELDIDRQSYRKHAPPAGICLDLARFLCDYSSDDLRVQSSGDSGMSFLWLFKGFPFNSSGTCSRGLRGIRWRNLCPGSNNCAESISGPCHGDSFR